ncbi:hypothetical protein LG293_16665 (plasmid) [Citricoccus nitrophenolicus]
MQMPATQWIVLALGIGLAVLTLTRIPAAWRGHNVNMLLAHAMITVVVLLSVSPIYHSVDSVMGGVNLANLLSHLCFPLIFLFGGLQIARSVDRPDIARKVAGAPGLIVAGVSLAAIIGTFAAIGVEPTSMGLNSERGNPWLILYKVSSYVYCTWVAAWVTPPLLRDATLHRQQKAHSYAQRALGVSMLAVSLLPLVHLAEFFAPDTARAAADVLVYSAIVLAASSPATLFFVRMGRNFKPGRSSRSGRPTR